MKLKIINYFCEESLGIGDWGLGIGDWGLGEKGTNPILFFKQ